MTQPLHTVHVRVNDAATGQPTPVRIRFTDEKGNYYAPFGRLTEFALKRGLDLGGNHFRSGNLLLNDKKYAYIDGTCEIQLPSDRIFIEVHKGPEYETLSHQAILTPGQLAIRLDVKRWSDLRQEGWFSGDTWVGIISPHGALLEGAAEDIAVVNLLAMELYGKKTTLIPNLLAFSGQQPALERDGCLVVVNTHNVHHLITQNGYHLLARLTLLNCHRVVYPLTFGQPFGLDNWTVADWCDQCHRKGGLVVWVPEPISERRNDKRSFFVGEPPADAVLGKVDALEFNRTSELSRDFAEDWYGLLSLGLRLPVVGGSRKSGSEQLLGGWRTYARLQPGEEFTYKNWIEAVRAGRTFATKGPLLMLTVNGQDPGATINLESPEQTVHVQAGVRRAFPPDRLELIVNGRVVAESNSADGSRLEMDIPIPLGGWIATAYWGCEDSQGGFKLLAHTSPIYVQVPGRRPPPDLEAGKKLLRHFDDMLEWVRTQARVENEDQRQRLAGIFERAKEEVTKRLGQRS
jgi:hypothetical protein